MKIQPKIAPDLTPELVYLKGQFALSKYTLPYYTCVVPLEFARTKMSLIEEIPESERITWKLEELFQRDIDWKRIHQKLVKYLQDPARPQFFNALTVVLLPRSGHGFSGDYTEQSAISAMDDPDLDPALQIGGIQLQPYKDSGGRAGKLRWDSNSIVGVAVDGQHRLAAIKELGQHKGEMNLSSIAVLFLIPDTRTGYVEPNAPESGIIEPLRRVFIDLNKNAKSPSRARQILLDDGDIRSLCARSTIGEALGQEPGEDRIPLALVDWLSEKNKFEKGPFVTTVLLLEYIVSRSINYRSSFFEFVPEEGETLPSEDQEEYIRKIEEWLKLSFSPSESELSELTTQVSTCVEREIPLAFDAAGLSFLRKRFEQTWRPLIYQVFSKLQPYAELRRLVDEFGFNKPQFVNYYIQNEMLSGNKAAARAREIEKGLKEEQSLSQYKKGKEAIDSHKAGNWAFRVVFQKALFDSFFAMLDQSRDFHGSEGDARERRAKMADTWISAINYLFEQGVAREDYKVGRESFWVGIGLRPEGKIDFTKSATKRLCCWLNAFACMHYLGSQTPTWDKLDGEHDNRVADILKRQCNYKDVIAGFERVVAAKGELLGDDAYNDAVFSLMERRYKQLRGLVTGRG
ncbi:MAG: hypothetical protein KDK35_21375 [Leptospiraceae bacterium]|nr:hypothetical protein [Leptospiraceae bacterium]